MVVHKRIKTGCSVTIVAEDLIFSSFKTWLPLFCAGSWYRLSVYTRLLYMESRSSLPVYQEYRISEGVEKACAYAHMFKGIRPNPANAQKIFFPFASKGLLSKHDAVNCNRVNAVFQGQCVILHRTERNGTEKKKPTFLLLARTT
jgi:hypothetical protein